MFEAQQAQHKQDMVGWRGGDWEKSQAEWQEQQCTLLSLLGHEIEFRIYFQLDRKLLKVFNYKNDKIHLKILLDAT